MHLQFEEVLHQQEETHQQEIMHRQFEEVLHQQEETQRQEEVARILEARILMQEDLPLAEMPRQETLPLTTEEHLHQIEVQDHLLQEVVALHLQEVLDLEVQDLEVLAVSLHLKEVINIKFLRKT